MKLTQKDRQKIAESRRSAERFNPKLNKACLSAFLQPHKIVIPEGFSGIIVRITRHYLHKHFMRAHEAQHILFGIGVDDLYDELSLVKKLRKSINRHNVKVKNSQGHKPIYDTLVDMYLKIFGHNPPMSATNKWMRDAISTHAHLALLALRPAPTGGYGNRVNKRRFGYKNNEGERLRGCSLDQQAELLGIFNKEFLVTRGKDEEGNPIKVSLVYHQMNRRERKIQNHQSYKATV